MADKKIFASGVGALFYREECRRAKQKVVAISGSFDILHAAHLSLIEFAKEQGDHLIILLNSDASIKLYKGNGRPILEQNHRAQLLLSLRAVDAVIIFDELTPVDLLATIMPDVYVNGNEYGEDCLESEILEKYGGKLLIAPKNDLYSTTDLLRKIVASESCKSNPAVFFDRDGTLIEDAGYLHTIDSIVWKEGVFDSVQKLSRAGFKIVIMTNQSGIGRGFYTSKEVEEVHKFIHEKFKQNGVEKVHIYYCPHHPDEHCICRKPEVGMLLSAATDLDIALSKSWVVGDKCSDIRAGRYVNSKTILVYREEDCLPGAHHTVSTLGDAVNIILKD